jgi:hypothetical protein
MADEQFEKAGRFCDKAGMEPVWFEQGYIEALPVDNRQSSGSVETLFPSCGFV